MTEMTSLMTALTGLYGLSAQPGPRERAILEAQLARIAAMLGATADPEGALFSVDHQTFPSVLAGLSREAGS